MSTPTASVPDMNSTSAASIIAIDAIAKRPLLIILLLHSVLGAMCVPLLLTVLYFSTAHLRRAPVFLLVIFQIIVGISYATWMSATMTHMLLYPLAVVSRSTYVAMGVLLLVTSSVIDSLLYLRLYAVFPLSSTPVLTFLGVFAFPVACRVSRIVVDAVALARWAPTVLAAPMTDYYATNNLPFETSPLLKAGYACELAEHAFAAYIFLRKLRPAMTHSERADSSTIDSKDSFVRRVRTLFFMALGSFTFPVVFNVIFLVISSIPTQAPNLFYLMAVNIFINIFGVVFATVWNASFYRQISSGTSEKPRALSPLAPLAFRPTQAGGVCYDSMITTPVSVIGGGRAVMSTSTTSASNLSLPSRKPNDREKTSGSA